MNWIDPIKNYVPYNEQEKKDQEMMLSCIKTFEDVLTRDNTVAHITSSSFVVNKARTKALMVYHNIYNSWSWTGGHADGDADLLAVAIREVKEETGVENISAVFPEIFSLDVLPVLGHSKKGSYVSAHLHLSVAYLLEADEEDPLIIKADENSDVRWIPINKVNEFSNEPHMRKVYGKLIAKMKNQA